MSCLSQRELARVALGLTEDAELTAHVEQCAPCRERLEAMQSLRHQLAETHAKFDEGHEEARERLLTLLPAASRPPELVKPRRQIAQWIGGFTMRQRIAALGSIGVAAALGFLLVWGGIDTKPVSAMEKMAENVRKAKSYVCKRVLLTHDEAVEPGKATCLAMCQTVYWLASGAERTETTYPDGSETVGTPREISITIPGKPGISIDHETKTFHRHAPDVRHLSSDADDGALQNLGKFSGAADRELGAKQINGKEARGFQISMKKIDSDCEDDAAVEIWIDPESGLPALVRFENMMYLGVSNTEINSDIQWNVNLDPKLFDTTPPEGYKDATPKLLPLEEQVRQITAGLRTYAEASGGHYWPGKDGDGLKAGYDLCKILGVRWHHETEDELATLKKVIKGLNLIGHLQATNPDAAYYGKTVSPNDKDQVLVRWKLDDGQYEVIFGDLRAETVTADRVRTLEGK